MAYRIAWSRTSLADLKAIVRYIGRDSTARAEAFGHRIVTKVEALADFPEIGRAVPEFQSAAIREIIVYPYRVIYRVDHSLERIEVVRLWHGARGEPDLA